MNARLDRSFHALANEPRREIVRRLGDGPATISELRDSFEFSKQAMSKHVAILEEAGLVLRQIDGRDHHLSLVTKPLDEVRAWIDLRTHAWESNFGRLHRLLGDDG